MQPKQQLIKKLKAKKIMVLMGGLTEEREISLLTGQAMLKALQALGLNASGLDIKKEEDMLRCLKSRPDVVVNGLHGPGGEDSQVQGILDWFGIPYTGPGVLAAALAMNKHCAKHMMKAAGLPTAPWVCLAPGERSLPKSLKLPLVIKPNRQGSAIGVSLVRKKQDLKKAFEQAGRFGDHVLVEKYITGKEVSVGVIGGEACAVIEIIPKKEFYDYEAKYVKGMSEHLIPARLTEAKTKEVQQLAVKTAALFGCEGTPRVDMIITGSGKIQILEVNTLPGMTATSLLPEAAAYGGLDFNGLVLHLVDRALGVKR